MIWVTLKDGTVLRYNDADRYTHGDKWVTIDIKDSGNLATINSDEVARIEYVRPCRIFKQRKPTRAE